MGIGAEQEMANFVSDDVAEHFTVADAGMVLAENQIVIVDVGVNAVARVIHHGLAEDVRSNGATARNDADGEVRRPSQVGTGRARGREVRRVRRLADQPNHLNTSVRKDG